MSYSKKMVTLLLLCSLCLFPLGALAVGESPTPTGSPAANATPDSSGDTVIEALAPAETAGYGVNLLYDKYPMYEHYFVALQATTVYAKPDGAKKIGSLSYGSRAECDAIVKGSDGDQWLRVKYITKDQTVTGYLKEKTGSLRQFQLKAGFDHVSRLDKAMDSSFTVRIQNYKNAKGLPPVIPNVGSTDEFGYWRDQAAPGYSAPNKDSLTRYVPDGMVGVRYEMLDGYSHIYFPTFDTYLWVPDKYVVNDAITDLNQIVIVDRKNQNLIMYEKNKDTGTWEIILKSVVSTGKTGGGSLPTPLGDYAAIEIRDNFIYKNNPNNPIYDGYALWVTRFCAGAYLHGVPTHFPYDPLNPVKIPTTGPESITSLGTTPQSHMCVRNFTSVAKFIHDRIRLRQACVIVMEQ